MKQLHRGFLYTRKNAAALQTALPYVHPKNKRAEMYLSLAE